MTIANPRMRISAHTAGAIERASENRNACAGNLNDLHKEIMRRLMGINAAVDDEAPSLDDLRQRYDRVAQLLFGWDRRITELREGTCNGGYWRTRAIEGEDWDRE